LARKATATFVLASANYTYNHAIDEDPLKIHAFTYENEGLTPVMRKCSLPFNIVCLRDVESRLLHPCATSLPGPVSAIRAAAFLGTIIIVILFSSPTPIPLQNSPSDVLAPTVPLLKLDGKTF
jgi:hypothetical protein